MKQHITVEQLEELSEKGMENFCKGPRLKYVLEADEHGYGCSIPDKYGGQVSFPLLSIGQMIEFLDENLDKSINIYTLSKVYPHWVLMTQIGRFRSDELVKALWEAVKEVLEK